MNANALLHQAIAAARDGRRDEARILLMRTLEAEPRNERAWLWLSGVVDDPYDVKICLENVLALNPSNARARRDWNGCTRASGCHCRHLRCRHGPTAAPSARSTPAPSR